MKYKAIVFDKDGTLVDFVRYWKPVSTFASKMIFKELGVENANIGEHLSALGFTEDGVSVKGPLPRGDHAEIAKAIYDFAVKNGSRCTFDEAVSAFARGYGEESKLQGEVAAPFEAPREVISSLRQKGFLLALITSDEICGAKICLDKLGVLDLFDEILAYDGQTPAKPDPAYMMKFCEKYSLLPSEVVMVGDTETDILFALNSGALPVGVAPSKESKSVLSDAGAAVVLHDASLLESYLFNV